MNLDQGLCSPATVIIQVKSGSIIRVYLVKWGLSGWARLRHMQGQYLLKQQRVSKSLLSWENLYSHFLIWITLCWFVSCLALSQMLGIDKAAALWVVKPDGMHIKAATTATNQLKLEEMGSACSVLLFVKGFAIAALARTMRRESNGKSNMMGPSAAPSSPDWVVLA